MQMQGLFEKFLPKFGEFLKKKQKPQKSLLALGLILVLAEVMIGVGRVTTSGRLEHQVPLMHEAVEPVTPAHLIWIEFLEHEKKLEGAKPWCLAADILDRTYYLFL